MTRRSGASLVFLTLCGLGVISPAQPAKLRGPLIAMSESSMRTWRFTTRRDFRSAHVSGFRDQGPAISIAKFILDID